MKKLTLILLLLNSIQYCNGQKSIIINGKEYPFQNIDSTKHRINGWWKVVGGEYFNDDDGTQSKEKWDRRDLGKRMLISDTLMQLYSPSASLFYEKPKYYYEVFDMRDKDAGLFFRKFPPKVVGVNIYEYQDAKVWRGKDYDFGYQWFYILNPDFLAYFGGGSQVLYLERINNNDDKYGWDQELSYKIIKYTGDTGYIQVDTKKDKYSKDSFLEVQFNPQNTCKDTRLEIATFPNYFIMGNDRKFLFQEKNITKKNIIIKIPVEKLLSNYITINPGNCNSDEEWILKWRIISKDVFKKIKYEKVNLNLSPSQPTKMYLIKDDEVEIIEEKEDWLKIRYYGKRTIEGWIKRSDVE